MIQVDRALFSNVATSIQRTSNLPGGGVSGLPGGVVIRGLQGVGSFAADIQDAQKEFERGRARTSLERVRQLDSLFPKRSGAVEFQCEHGAIVRADRFAAAFDAKAERGQECANQNAATHSANQQGFSGSDNST